MEQRLENLPLINVSKWDDLINTEHDILCEVDSICHVEHLQTYASGWNLANDDLRTTLCVRFKSEDVASGIVY
jgi:hypothetical protein